MGFCLFVCLFVCLFCFVLFWVFFLNLAALRTVSNINVQVVTAQPYANHLLHITDHTQHVVCHLVRRGSLTVSIVCLNSDAQKWRKTRFPFVSFLSYMAWCRWEKRGRAQIHVWEVQPVLFLRKCRCVNVLVDRSAPSHPQAAPSRLVGLVVKASASRVEDQRFESRLRRDFSASSHTSDLNIGTPVATLPGAWRYRVNAGTGRPGVSIL